MANKQKEESLLVQKDKTVFKNWKTYAIAAGVIVIGTGAGVGIYYGVNSKSEPTVRDISEQDISNAIGTTNYTLETSIETEASILNSGINANFIQGQLTGEFKTAFNASLFDRDDKIMVQEDNEPYAKLQHELTDADLVVAGTINAKIGYKYGSIEGKELNLTITVINDSEKITDQEISNAIAGGTYQLNDIEINTSVADINNEINKDDKKFFKSNLSEEMASAFIPTSLSYDKIMNGDKELVNEDLTIEGIIEATITYTYGDATTNKINLTINVVDNSQPSITDQEISNAIAGGTYQLNDIEINTSIADINNEINKDDKLFFKSNLSEEMATAFIPTSLSYDKIMNGDNELIDEDLTIEGIIEATITYTYGDATTNKINLTINVVDNSQPSITDQEISNAIAGGTYQLNDIKINTSIADIFTVINNDDKKFFKDQLNNENLENAFKGELLHLNEKIMNGDNELTNEDLKEEKTIKATLAYTYGQAQENKINLTINVVVLSDHDIWQEIADTKFELTLASGTTAKDANGKVRENILKQLPVLYQKYFDAKKFTPSSLYKLMDDKQITIDDNDLKESGIKTFWIRFGYGTVTGNGTAEFEITLT